MFFGLGSLTLGGSVMFDVIIVASGKSSRMGTINKLLFEIGSESVLSKSIRAFISHPKITSIIIVTNSDSIRDVLSAFPQEKVICVAGGETRSDSVESGLKCAQSDYVLIHDAARPFVSSDLVSRIMESVEKKGSGIPVLPISDSVGEISNTGELVGRAKNKHVSIQTPQGFITTEIKKAYELRNGITYPDESSLYISTLNKQPLTVIGDSNNIKLTTPADLFGLNSLIGIGYDLHRLIPNRKLVLGGIEIASDLGPLAHSDGDALIHALIDALLSAMGSVDIGTHFPNTSPQFKDADSTILLSNVYEMLKSKHLTVSNISLIAILDSPKLSDYIPLMKIKISNLLNISQDMIGISAKTSEGTHLNMLEAFAAVKLL
jgi:2-C-methyl-D-erythritol 4-phosphate cytidylyltransferase/2-C-methyl-D-erythritol 2,4-cyclodiphosphate synthase